MRVGSGFFEMSSLVAVSSGRKIKVKTCLSSSVMLL